MATKKRRIKGKSVRVGDVLFYRGYESRVESKTPTKRFFSRGTAYKVKLSMHKDPILLLGEEEVNRVG